MTTEEESVNQPVPLGGWSWIETEPLPRFDETVPTLSHPETGTFLAPVKFRSSGWVSIHHVTDSELEALVTGTTFTEIPDTDPLADDDVRQFLQSVEDGLAHMEAISIEEPVNKHFVDVRCVKPGTLPEDLTVEDISESTEQVLADLYEGSSNLNETDDPTDPLEITIDMFPTPTKRVTESNLE